MGIKVEWKEKGDALFLVDSDGQIHGKVLAEPWYWEAWLDGAFIGEFWDRICAQRMVLRRMSVTPYELVKFGE